MLAAVTMLLAGGPATAGETPVNLLGNPGYESGIVEDVQNSYPTLVERGVVLPSGDMAAMPTGVRLNPTDGWKGGGEMSFEYVTGTAGKDVHTGRHAVKIISQDVRSAIFVGNPKGLKIPVEDNAGVAENAIPRGKPCKVGFYSKGKGAFSATVYCYDLNGDFLKEGGVTSTPSIFEIDDSDWTLHEGTLMIDNPEVVSIFLVFGVEGAITIDDAFLGE